MIKIHCGNYTDRRIHLWCVLRETIVTIILQMQPLYNPQRSTYPDPPKICHATTASNDNISHSKRTKDLHGAPNSRKNNLTYDLSTKKFSLNRRMNLWTCRATRFGLSIQMDALIPTLIKALNLYKVPSIKNEYKLDKINWRTIAMSDDQNPLR